MSDIKFSSRILRRFVETVALELGPDQFNGMLVMANLPAEWKKNPDVSLGIKAQAAVVKRLPLASRRKPTLELLAKFLSAQSNDIVIHTLDLDLLFVDNASPAAHDQSEPKPICFVTQGLIRESLFWATGKNYDVEEIHCKAQGEHACEFKVTGG